MSDNIKGEFSFWLFIFTGGISGNGKIHNDKAVMVSMTRAQLFKIKSRSLQPVATKCKVKHAVYKTR
jgi:hypothetical protein